MLDTYEFICAGMDMGDLDEKVIKDTYRGVMIKNTKRAKHFIEAICWGEHGVGIDHARPAAWEKLRKYVAKWEQEYEEERLKLLSKRPRA